ncbi:MAG: hypothetical protein K8F31_05250 [Roseovarius sp.]|nr:hypothetical protein [Roseovarius sp.]
MPLQNRVSPFGELFADRSRGLLFGNRGGRIHRDDRTLSSRRWTSRAWICCVLSFKGRRRKVWGEGYTQLFFLDEVTALAAGHRPCFECRRKDAEAFAALWPGARKHKDRARAAEMDIVLQAERLDGRAKRRHRLPISDLPDGASIVMPGEESEAAMLRGGRLLRWTSKGYAPASSRPRRIKVEVLTPPSILAVLKAGYRPLWHPSADI